MEKDKIRLLLLYMELADYTVECLRYLKKVKPEIDIHVVAYPVNKEAPFNFNFSEIGKLYNRDKFDHEQIQLFTDKLVPNVIICSGWTDRSYLKVVRTWKNIARTVLCMDNQWLGSWKQRIASIAARFYLPRVFEYIWVPFHQHVIFAKHLGFADKRIKIGFYSGNAPAFDGYYQKFLPQKTAAFPSVFICVARYIPQKNLKTLWEAFVELDQEYNLDWELWNLGQGEGYNSRMQYPKIKHHGFVQPKEIPEFIGKSGIFVLSSLFEPWGVVLHEFAAAGMPLLVSKNVGAHAAFLKNGENGYTFNPLDKQDLKNKMLQMINLPESALLEMGKKSNDRAKIITPQKWVDTFLEIASDA